jgi:haloacetate dehalogenase
MKLGDHFVDFSIPVTSEITISGSQAGNGPPLVLLHGFPQTNLIWHKIASQLAESYQVIAPDLRGYGASSKPKDDGSHKIYAKSAMAKDVATLMDHLGHKEYYVCGHDRGARVAHKLCVDYPGRVKKVMMLDIAPTLAMFTEVDQLFATVYWHWFFLVSSARPDYIGLVLIFFRSSLPHSQRR